MQPPRELSTARLLLRAPTEGDIGAIFEYAGDPEVTEFMDWQRRTHRDEVHDFLSRTEAGWANGTEFLWVITRKGVDTVIGGISVRVREAEGDFGYVLNRRYWGRGFTTEAAGAVTGWALEVRKLPRLWATCDAENIRSIRVLEKLGLKREGLVPGGIVRPNLSNTPRDAYLYGTGSPGTP